jgi:hypothetical protein
MRLALQNPADEGACGGPERSRLAPNAFDGPVGVTPVRARHVLRDGRVPAAMPAARMDGDALALVEDLDRVGCEARLDLLFDEPEGYGVVVPVEIDMVVERHAP